MSGTTAGGAFRYPYAYDTLVDLPEDVRTALIMDRDRALEDYLTVAAGDTVVTVAASDTPRDLAANADYVCDGASDEAEIQAALDSFDSGGAVVLLPGTFNTLGDINPGAHQSLIGSGRTTTTIEFGGTGYAVSAVLDSVRIAHLTIQTEDAAGLPLQVAGGTSLVFDCYLLQNNTSATDPAVSLGGTGSQMSNCHVVASDIGVTIPSGYDRIVLSHNYIEADTGVVLGGCSFCLVTANQIRGVGAATGHGILAEGNADDNSIIGNTLGGYGVDGIRLINVSAATPDRNNIQLNKLFKTVSAGDGYGINIASGTGNLCANNFITSSGALGDFNDAGTSTLGTGGVPTSYTDEQAQDAVGTILVDTATVDFTYTDATPSITADVKDDSITNAKLANVATATIKGRTTSGTGDPEDLTATQVRTLLDVPTNAEAVLDTLIDAKGDLIAGTASDTPARVAVGTDGQLLKADSGATPGVSWATHDGTGDPHGQYVQESLFDAKGDILAASADNTPARLAVGTNGQVLTADSTQATGVKWADAGGGGSGDGLMPYFIPADETYTVPEYRQGLFVEPIDVEGLLDVEGILIEVTQAPDLSALLHMQLGI